MQARIKSPALAVPGLLDALLSISRLVDAGGVPRTTLELVQVRVGQINGCSVCVDMHVRALEAHGETNARLATIAVWREAPYFTEAERAALALAEAATRLADRPDPVPAEIWSAAAAHYPESALAALVTSIAMANLWNRLNVTTGQITGEWVAQLVR